MVKTSARKELKHNYQVYQLKMLKVVNVINRTSSYDVVYMGHLRVDEEKFVEDSL